jgi:hypothetical protein
VIGGFYFFPATKDGNVCDDDGVEAGSNVPAFFIGNINNRDSYYWCIRLFAFGSKWYLFCFVKGFDGIIHEYFADLYKYLIANHHL